MGSTGKNSNTSTKLLEDGQLNKDGSMTIRYVHMNTGGSQVFGNQFGQKIEPSGKYINYISPTQSNTVHGAEYGTVQFDKPLLLEWKSTGPNGWKKDLSEMYGGKTGKSLSKAIIKDGYDAIVTWEMWKGSRVWNEIVNLKSLKG